MSKKLDEIRKSILHTRPAPKTDPPKHPLGGGGGGTQGNAGKSSGNNQIADTLSQD